MIIFMPSVYPDELAYSWSGRYFAHSGHSAYMSAVEDLTGKKNIRPDVEFINRMSDDARTVITKTVSMEELILNHTMFPYYRFAEPSRLCSALKAMSEFSDGDIHRLLPVTKNRTAPQKRYIKYCPVCTAEAMEKKG